MSVVKRVEENNWGVLLQSFEGCSMKITAVAFSPDGNYIVSGSADCTIKLWKIGGDLVTTFNGHSGAVKTISFLPDGLFIASGSDDGTVNLWEFKNGSLAQQATGNLLASLKDGWLVAALTENSVVFSWVVSTGELTFDRYCPEAVSIHFSKDGVCLALRVFEVLARMYEVESGKVLTEFKRKGVGQLYDNFPGTKFLSQFEENVSKLALTESKQILILSPDGK
ncbi:hypothetical protein HK100_008690 [Physocladia obscura]|uniref:Uncharacterized protein n=1 Tax=Physocladia obscura TaxID=109957 RepID=A0AAD5XIB0_9FUNG|nr:hypothetical protein HK100_008690 [Physocladia obscura]